MIKMIKNPVELFVFISLLKLFTPPSKTVEKKFKKIISSHFGNNYKEQQELAKNKLEFIDDVEKLNLATESLKKMQEENKESKKEILSIIEKIIFMDIQVVPTERKLYHLAIKYLEEEPYPISPSIELFEYIHVLNYVAKSECASINDFVKIWKKYMGPDIVYFDLEAQKNLNDLTLEEQLTKIDGHLKKMNELSLEEKTNIKLMVEEIILLDNVYTKQEKVVYVLLMEHLELESNLQTNSEKHRTTSFFSKIVLNPFFIHFINLMIVLSSIFVGLQTDKKISNDFSFEIQVIDIILQYIFLSEILMRFFAEWNRPKAFFSSGWNCFDFALVVGSFLPLGNFPLIIRLLRLARLAKLLERERHLRIIIHSFLHSIKPTGFVSLVLVIIIYIYAVIGFSVFSENDPIHFGTLLLSMQSILQLAFEGWSDILYIQMYGCKDYGYTDYEHLCNFSSSRPVTALIYFISFIVISGLVVVNLVIGIIIDNWNVSKELLEKEDNLEIRAKHIDNVVGKIRAKRFENYIIDKEN